MSHSYIFEMTQQDIDLGAGGTETYCPISTTICRKITSATRPLINDQTISFSIGRHRFTYLTPGPARDWLIAYDAGDTERLKPIKFELRNPMITERRPRGAQRLIVKGEGQREVVVKAEVGRNTRIFGRRAYRVNQEPGQVA